MTAPEIVLDWLTTDAHLDSVLAVELAEEFVRDPATQRETQ